MTIDEMKNEIDRLETKLKELKTDLSNAMIEASPFKVGDVYQNWGRKAEIIKVYTSYGHISLRAAYYNKDGKLSKRDFYLMSDNWRKVEQ